MAKIAVIGSNSFSGAHLINIILEKTNWKIIGISRSPEYNPIFLPYKYKKTVPQTRFSFFKYDLNKNAKEIIGILDREKPEVIVNFAAQGEVQHSWDYPQHWFNTNCTGIVHFVNELRKRKYVQRYIQISTPEVYGTCEGKVTENHTYKPSTPYAASKASGDLFLYAAFKSFNFPVIFIRSTNVYGIHQQLYRIIPRTIIYLKQGRDIMLHGGGHAIKSYIHIRDVAHGILKACEKGKIGEIYHFSPEGDGQKVRDIVKMVCDIIGSDFTKHTKTVEDRIGQDLRYVLDSTKAKEELNWSPTITLNEGIKEMVEWVNENWEEIQKQPLEYIHKE